jgi:transcriptional regulator with XRE-family HTH domain
MTESATTSHKPVKRFDQYNFKLADAIARNKLTNKVLADKLGLCKQTISNLVCRRHQQPSVEVAKAITRTLGCAAEDLGWTDFSQMNTAGDKWNNKPGSNQKNLLLLFHMKRNGINSISLSKISGVNKATISQLLNMKETPCRRTAQAIATALDSTPEALGMTIKIPPGKKNLLLLDAINRNNLTLQELQDASTISRKAIAKLINKKSIPTRRTAQALAKVFNCTTRQLGFTRFTFERNNWKKDCKPKKLKINAIAVQPIHVTPESPKQEAIVQAKGRNQLILDAMLKKNMNIIMLAKASGLNKKSISTVINRKTIPSRKSALAISIALDSNPEALGMTSRLNTGKNTMLLEAMNRQGMNFMDLVMKSKVNRSTVCTLINQRSIPTMKTAMAICDALGCTAKELGFTRFALDNKRWNKPEATKSNPATMPQIHTDIKPINKESPPMTEQAKPVTSTQQIDIIKELRIFLEIAHHQNNGTNISYGPFQWNHVRSLESKGLIIIHQYIKNSTEMVPTITEKGMVYLESLLDTPMPVAKTTWLKR